MAGMVAAIVASGTSAVAVGSTNGYLVPLVPAALAVGVAAVVTVIQRRVVWRPRPALPVALARADDLLRAQALETLDAAGGALLWLLAATAFARVATRTSSILVGPAALGAVLAVGIAVWLAIRSQLATMALSGALPARSALPTIRQLASDLGIAKGTVNKAYEGWSETA